MSALANKKIKPMNVKPLPVVLCLDISNSMQVVVDNTNFVKTGEGINEAGKKVNIGHGGITRLDKLKEALSQLYNTLSEEIKTLGLEVAIVTFNDTVTVVENFVPMKESKWQTNLPKFGTGQTYMGEAAMTSLDLIEARRAKYEQEAKTIYQPWFLMFTDGENNGDKEILEAAIKRANHLEKANKVMTYCFGINDDKPNLSDLKRLNNNHDIYGFEAVQLMAIFKIITDTIANTMTGQTTNPKYQLDEAMKELLREGRA